MSDGVHLLIPFASRPDPGCRDAIRKLRLPRLAQLLARWSEEAPDHGDPGSLSAPHERAWARAHGWAAADGLVPLAASQAMQGGLPGHEGAWACIAPCHWLVGRDHVDMADPDALQLDEAASRALLAIVAPYFEQDGLTLHYRGPLLWLAQGPLFEDVPTASLDRVIGRDIDAWMPRSEAARPLRRLQQEMQMLLYTSPLNDERQARGLLPVNSLWISGTGRLPPPAPTARAEPQFDGRLRSAALRGDWAAWAAAWEQVDAGLADATRITLCGEANARTWSATGSRSLGQRLGALWRGPDLPAILESL